MQCWVQIKYNSYINKHIKVTRSIIYVHNWELFSYPHLTADCGKVATWIFSVQGHFCVFSKCLN